MDQEKIQEMQMLEQNLQNLMMHKQSFEMELSETNAALKEISETNENEIFKVVGQLMIKSEKSKVRDELENKQKLLEMRIQSFEKQEDSLSEKLEKLRAELTKN